MNKQNRVLMEMQALGPLVDIHESWLAAPGEASAAVADYFFARLLVMAKIEYRMGYRPERNWLSDWLSIQPALYVTMDSRHTELLEMHLRADPACCLEWRVEEDFGPGVMTTHVELSPGLWASALLEVCDD